MSADLNNGLKRFTLPRNVILRGERNFERLFSEGKRLSTRHIDFRYIMMHEPAHGFKVAFVAGRKLGNAVIRNRCKRQLREAFRLHQHILTPETGRLETGFNGVFIAKRTDADQHAINADCAGLLSDLRRILEKQGS